jgi:hypothetical protein
MEMDRNWWENGWKYINGCGKVAVAKAIDERKSFIQSQTKCQQGQPLKLKI